MKLSTVTWIAAIVVMTYYLASLGMAYHTAMTSYFDSRHGQIAQLIK